MGYYNGKQVDQGVASKAQQDPEGEMEGTETEAAAEAHQTLARDCATTLTTVSQQTNAVIFSPKEI